MKTYLRLYKDWLKLGLSPIELLVLGQVAEFNLGNNECFESDAKFAEDFNVSESTITRALRSLEGKGFITRYTRSTQQGRTRTITYNEAAVDEAIANVKMTLAETSN